MRNGRDPYKWMENMLKLQMEKDCYIAEVSRNTSSYPDLIPFIAAPEGCTPLALYTYGLCSYWTDRKPIKILRIAADNKEIAGKFARLLFKPSTIEVIYCISVEPWANYQNEDKTS